MSSRLNAPVEGPDSSSSSKPHQGTLILVLGTVSLFGPRLILGPIAWALGHQDLARMDAGKLDPSGRDQTRLGMRLGILGTALSALGVALLILSSLLS